MGGEGAAGASAIPNQRTSANAAPTDGFTASPASAVDGVQPLAGRTWQRSGQSWNPQRNMCTQTFPSFHHVRARTERPRRSAASYLMIQSVVGPNGQRTPVQTVRRRRLDSDKLPRSVRGSRRPDERGSGGVTTRFTVRSNEKVQKKVEN